MTVSRVLCSWNQKIELHFIISGTDQYGNTDHPTKFGACIKNSAVQNLCHQTTRSLLTFQPIWQIYLELSPTLPLHLPSINMDHSSINCAVLTLVIQLSFNLLTHSLFRLYGVFILRCPQEVMGLFYSATKF